MNTIKLMLVAAMLALVVGCTSGGSASASFPQHDYWWRTAQ